MWRSRSKMEFLLSTKHRVFLQSLKIDSPGKLPKPYYLTGPALRYMFSININGKVREYSTIFRDLKTITSLEDPEMVELCKSFRKTRVIVLIMLPVVITLLLVMLYSV